MTETVVFDIQKIQEILPHRYPFLLVDKIVEFIDNERAVGIKAVTFNENFFQGHFPGRPIMPGVLIMEAMAQVGAVLASQSSDGVAEGKLVMLAGANEFRWKKPVVPGDMLKIVMESQRKRRPMWKMKGTVYVQDMIIATGEITAAES
jgi:3-hydroxyacyl-[acyl-carrier-protein] dehydratase